MYALIFVCSHKPLERVHVLSSYHLGLHIHKVLSLLTAVNGDLAQQMVASTWLGDHRVRPSAPTNSLHKLRMTRYQVHQLQLQLAAIHYCP